ncbi:hypothetical protein C8J57DRAFT_429960 [Mycena rebaudengoi]|nr:hypothetical protein C8J57DRAFT_429960 [Mycena rebaudengoi]
MTVATLEMRTRHAMMPARSSTMAVVGMRSGTRCAGWCLCGLCGCPVLLARRMSPHAITTTQGTTVTAQTTTTTITATPGKMMNGRTMRMRSPSPPLLPMPRMHAHHTPWIRAPPFFKTHRRYPLRPLIIDRRTPHNTLLAPRALRREAVGYFWGWWACHECPSAAASASSASGHWAGADSDAWGRAEGGAFKEDAGQDEKRGYAYDPLRIRALHDPLHLPTLVRLVGVVVCAGVWGSCSTRALRASPHPPLRRVRGHGGPQNWVRGTGGRTGARWDWGRGFVLGVGVGGAGRGGGE